MGKLGWVKAFVTDLGEWLNVDKGTFILLYMYTANLL